MILVQMVLATALTAGAQTVALPESASLSPAAAPAGQIPMPPPPPGAAEAPPMREHEVQPPPVPFQEELRAMQSQLKMIEAKGSSRSTGQAYRRGNLRNPAQLPLEGLGFRVLRPERHSFYGTDGMIAGVIEASARLRQADPEMEPVVVGDVSGPKGGRIARHRSHRSGRDADLVFFWTDLDGRPVRADELIRFNRLGRAQHKSRPVVFDVRRNWALVRALLTSPHFGERVRWIFVYHPLRKLLLDYADRHEGDLYVTEYAWRILQQPGATAGRHDDHFHLRIGCSAEESAEGCRD